MSGVIDLNVNFKGQIKSPVEEHMGRLSGYSLYCTCTFLKGFFPNIKKKICMKSAQKCTYLKFITPT